MFRMGEPDEPFLRSLLERCATASVTYDEVGATRNETQPAGYAHDRYRVNLGLDAFDRGVAGLRAWQAHIGAGVNVFPADAAIHEGTDVIVAAKVGPAYALAPCRIVYAIDEPDRFGFGYGTLPGHPEQGEESFVIERGEDAHTTFSIVAFSKPAALLARLGSPVARWVQRRTTHAYLDALHNYAVR
jgi:uncharacterized protein (UPF0548 family)